MCLGNWVLYKTQISMCYKVRFMRQVYEKPAVGQNDSGQSVVGRLL